MKKYLVLLLALGLATLFFVIKGQTMQTPPLAKDDLRKAVINNLNSNLFEPSECTPNLRRGDGKTLTCFLTHLEYRQVIETIALSLKPFVDDPRTPWNRLGMSWQGDYLYRENKKLSITFTLSEISTYPEWKPDSPMNDAILPNWGEFSTYVYFDIYEEQ